MYSCQVFTELMCHLTLLALLYFWLLLHGLSSSKMQKSKIAFLVPMRFLEKKNRDFEN